MAQWIKFSSSEVATKALECANGDYQRDLLCGKESWSGSTLTGAAKSWGSRYKTSRMALIKRLREAGLTVDFETIERRKVAVISAA